MSVPLRVLSLGVSGRGCRVFDRVAAKYNGTRSSTLRSTYVVILVGVVKASIKQFVLYTHHILGDADDFGAALNKKPSETD
jgi:hypothetical protein